MKNNEREQNRPNFYPGDELHFAKLEKTRAAMLERNFDGLIFVLPEAVRYFTDLWTLGPRVFWEYNYLAFVTQKEVVLCYTSGSDDNRVSRIKDLVTECRRVPQFPKWPEAIEKLLIDYGLQRGKVGVDILPFELYLWLSKKLPAIEFGSASDIWGELTAIKHPQEIELVRRAIKIAEIGMRVAIDSLQEGKTETEVAAEAEYAMKREPDGSEISPFSVIVTCPPRISERISTPNKIKTGWPIYIDLGAVYRGYTGEFGRTSIIGMPTKRQKEVFQIVLKSLQTAIELIKPGVKCSEIDKKARDVFRDAGFERMHTRATGHQLGYGLHSEPLIGPDVDKEIKENMIINLEPRLEFYDEPEPWGLQIEDTVLVTKTGHEYITTFEYDSRFLSGF